MSTIPLAKGFDVSKLVFPVFVSEKLDGVPVRIDLTTLRGKVQELRHRSRQDKPIYSVVNQVEMLAHRAAKIIESGRMTFVAEITHDTISDFKDASGIIRRQEYCDNLVLNVFDFDMQGSDKTFDVRIKALFVMMDHIVSRQVTAIPQRMVHGPAELMQVLAHLNDMNPHVEGWVARSHNALFKPGARHWDYQKIVSDPTVDLHIIGVEEAIDKFGTPKGMAGGLLAAYHNEVIGIGPGKLTHKERIDLWQLWLEGKGMSRLAKIQYKRDDSYTALRQPTFQCWRLDKDDVSYD